MRTRTLLALLIMVMIGAFVALNWPAFNAPTGLTLGYYSFEAPLGLLMLALLAGVSALFLAQMLVWQGTVLLETRRHTKELQAQRKLADEAEASRFTELRAAMLAEFERFDDRLAKSQDALRGEVREGTNSLAAMIGEIEDRWRPPEGDAPRSP